MTARMYGFFAASLAAALSLNCYVPDGYVPDSGGHEGAGHATRGEDSTLAAAGARQATLNATLEPGALALVSSAPVAEFAGPGNRPFEVATRSGGPPTGHMRRFGTLTLPTSLRGSATVLGQYPCTSCHFGRRVVMRDERISDAHQNIDPVHPQRVGAMCSTCHSVENVETLVLESGERPSLDHAYRLCAQCHYSQAESWAGGAHGKRLDGWQGRRVLMSCTDCHDPHRPATEHRAPFQGPRLERRRIVR